ncbi:hypothetical protein [Streptomyces sp. NPDC050804]|uniref:restriction endonuclease subunit S n=1 Tax=unclassified Streptomyces TaxID=2593676 RepID=UPI003445260A|nr:restriction endonuclease subunit S [Streptomyces sp. NBC_00872]
MTAFPLTPLGSVLTKSDDLVRIDPGREYSTAGLLNRGRGLFKRPTIMGSETQYTRYNRLKSGQLVYSKLFAWEGALAVVPSEFSGMHVSHEFPTFEILKNRADPRYIGHLVTWSDLHDALSKQTSGMGSRRQRVNVDQLLGTKVPLPEDIGEQRRIADRLDAALGRADGVRALREKMTGLQADLTASLIASALKSATDTVLMGDVVSFERTPVDINPQAEYRTIGIRSFGKGFIRHPPIISEGLSKLKYFAFPANALALSNLMAWEGGISVTGPEDTRHIASNRFFFYLPIADRVNTSYLRHFLLSSQGLALVSSACSAGAERNRTLGRKRFENLTFPLPPRPIQDRVARTLDALDEQLNAAYSEPALNALRPSILNAAFTGQL